MSAGNDNAPPAPRAKSPGFAWLLFDFSGRIDRELYWHGIGLVWTTVLAVAAFAAARGDAGVAVAVMITAVAPVWPEMALMSKRLRDIGLPGVLCVLNLVPMLGTALTVLIGLPPSRNSRKPPPPAGG